MCQLQKNIFYLWYEEFEAIIRKLDVKKPMQVCINCLCVQNMPENIQIDSSNVSKLRITIRAIEHLYGSVDVEAHAVQEKQS